MTTLPLTRRLVLAVRERRSADRRDRGVTLVELLVSTAILAIVLPLAGALLTGALTSQRDVGSLTSAANDAQTVATSVETGVRNASAIKRTTHTPTSGTQPNEMLVARTQLGRSDTQQWYCQAWYYDAVAGVVYSKRVVANGSGITAPSDGNVTTWTELARGVVPVARTTPAPSPVPVFTVTATRVELGFSVAAGTRKPVVMSTAISKRPQGQTGSAPCF